jgi:lysophospholipase
MKKLFLSVLFYSVSLWSFENYHYVNKNYKITQEKELETLFTTKIHPHFLDAQLHYFSSFDGLKIAYKIFKVKDPKATIVISNGRTEGMVKYQELIYDFNQNGYNVYILDHRGQGYSERLLQNKQIGYVEDFLDYVKDLRIFVKTIVKKHKKMILLGHSMGGAIASLYVEMYKKDFQALVLSSPMHQPELLTKGLSNTMCKLLRKRQRDTARYIIGEKSYDEGFKNFQDNLLTHSKIRYNLSNRIYSLEPNTKLGGPSVHWVSEACRCSRMSIDLANNIKIPILLLQASNDKIVNLEPQNEFCRQSQNYCQGLSFEGAYHELLIEKDPIRNKVLSAIFNFIAKI